MTTATDTTTTTAAPITPALIFSPEGNMQAAVKTELAPLSVGSHARHGDRYIMRIEDDVDFSELTVNTTNARFVLAEGNNGHEHALMPVQVSNEGELVLDDEGNTVMGDLGKLTIYEGINTPFPQALRDVQNRFETDMPREARFTCFKAEEAVELRHEEHFTILLPPGNYIAWGQREFGPKEQRMVMD
jgi:hypothetical protein